NLDLRFTAGAGPGYQWIESDDLNFSTEVGVVWFSENYSNDTPDVNHTAARIAYILNGNIVKGLAFSNSVDWYPSLESRYDQYLLAKAGLTLNLTDSLVANAMVLYQWNSQPAQDAKRVDVSYILGIGWSF